MRSYRDERGVFHRTQLEAKASGFPFEMFDIPTDHAGLIEFVNKLSIPVPAPSQAEEPEWITRPAEVGEAQHGLNDVWVGDMISVRNPAYQNGDPTTPFMGSRDPAAIFTCVQCGANNRNFR